MMNSCQDFCRYYGRLQCTLQFIAIEITIMHKIQIEWNSIRHSLMSVAPYLYGFSLLSLDAMHFLSGYFRRNVFSPPLSLNSHVRSRKLTPIITRAVSFEARRIIGREKPLEHWKDIEHEQWNQFALIWPAKETQQRQL